MTYDILAVSEFDNGIIIQTDIKESFERRDIKLRVNPKVNSVSIIRYDEIFAKGTFKNKTISAFKRNAEKHVVLTYEDMNGKVMSMYLKKPKG